MFNRPEMANPFVGPRPYRLDEQDRFFGRDREVQELMALIVAHPAVLFYAQSGAGKTSLINARLIPCLHREGFEVFPVARVSGVLPSGITPDSISNVYLYGALLGWMAPQDKPERLTEMSLVAFLDERPHLRDETGDECPRVLLFDQFEELFTLYSDRWQERAAFFREIDEALKEDRLLRVVFASREDYLAHFDAYATLLTDRLRGRFHMECLRRNAALSATTGPLIGTGRSFDKGVAERLVDALLKIRVETISGETVQVTGEFVEPVQLQVVCHNLWKELPEAVTIITAADLRRLGDVDEAVDRALERFYEDAIAAVVKETGMHQSGLRQWCQSQLITETGTRSIVHRAPETTGGMPNTVVSILENRHLIRSEWRAGARWYELTHDRFVGPILASNARWDQQRDEKVNEAMSLLRRTEQRVARGQYTDSLSESQKALLLTEEIGDLEGMALSLTYIGRLQGLLQRLDEAVDAFYSAMQIQDALGDQNGVAYSLFSLGHLFHDAERYEDARMCFDKYIQWLPGDPDGYGGYAAACWYSGKYEEAVEYYTSLIEMSPRSFNAYSGRGQVFAEMGQYAKAIKDLDRALELAAHDTVGAAYAHSGRGLAYAGLKQYDRALKEFEVSIRLSPGNAWVYYNRSLAYEWMGQHGKALNDLERALSKNDPRLNPLKRQKSEERQLMLKEKIA